MSDKRYLGDSVYAEKNSQGIVLTTENDDSGPSNVIFLDSQVFSALMNFAINEETT